MTEYKLPAPDGQFDYRDGDALVTEFCYTAATLRDEIAKAEKRGAEMMKEKCIALCKLHGLGKTSTAAANLLAAKIKDIEL